MEDMRMADFKLTSRAAAESYKAKASASYDFFFFDNACYEGPS
jgi:hypothetical protein